MFGPRSIRSFTRGCGFKSYGSSIFATGLLRPDFAFRSTNAGTFPHCRIWIFPSVKLSLRWTEEPVCSTGCNGRFFSRRDFIYLFRLRNNRILCFPESYGLPSCGGYLCYLIPVTDLFFTPDK